MYIVRKYEWSIPDDYELQTSNRGVLRPLGLKVTFKRQY